MDGQQSKPTRCFVALGGNLGPVAETFDRAIDCLAAVPLIALGRKSTNHTFPAVGQAAGNSFLNAAVELFTRLEPLALLERLQEIEDRLGRERTVRWGPRTLDLDLLLFGESVLELPRLQVPHPACWYRRFVLDPLAEIAAAVVHPVKNLTIRELRERLLVRPLRVALTGDSDEERRRIAQAVRRDFPAVACEADWHPGNPTPVLLFRLGGPDPAELPLQPRLDVPATADRPRFVADVLSSALGE